MAKKLFAPLTGTDEYLVSDDRADLVIYTQAWADDHPAKSGEDIESLIFCRVFLNGHEIKRQSGISFKFGPDFIEAHLTLIPSDIQIVALDNEQWVALGNEQEGADR